MANIWKVANSSPSFRVAGSPGWAGVATIMATNSHKWWSGPSAPTI